MVNPGYRHFKSEDWVDPTPPPASLPSVDEVGSTRAPLNSAAYFIGNVCKEYNEDFMLCKNEDRHPEHCMLEGRKVTRCAIEVMEKIQANCGEEFRAHWQCLDNKNQEFGKCRTPEKAYNGCLFKALGWKKTIPFAPAERAQLYE